MTECCLLVMPCYALCVCRVASKVEQTLAINGEVCKMQLCDIQNSVTSVVKVAQAAALKSCSGMWFVTCSGHHTGATQHRRMLCSLRSYKDNAAKMSAMHVVETHTFMTSVLAFFSFGISQL